ncbi:MAG: LptF/LptG family permease, partial [Thermoguttaceae bacterium]
MTLLDRYILKSFFFNLLSWCVCLVGIFIVFDIFTNLDTLLEIGKASGNTLKVLGTYYFFKSIPILMMVSSVLGLLAAMITMAMMMRNNEIVPIQAAGISTIRIIRPLLLAVVCLAITATVVREFVLPHFLDELVMESGDLLKKNGSLVNMTIDNTT